jgi:RHS repeat-associated protein
MVTNPTDRKTSSTASVEPKTRAYSPYGYFKAGSSTALLGFNGQRLDPSINGYALGNGNRIFHPTLFRFSTPDSFSPFGEGGLNAYAYCEDDPVNRTDPSGRFFQGIRKKSAPKPPSFTTISKLIERNKSISYLARELPLQNFKPQSYESALATYGNPFEQPPGYTHIPYDGQQTRAINLGKPLTPISELEATSHLLMLNTKKDIVTRGTARAENPEMKKMIDLEKIDKQILIIYHRRALAIRQTAN